jgi:hypothetical protein
MTSNNARKVELLKFVKKGGAADSAKEWLDTWVWENAWDTLRILTECGPDHIKLLEVQAQAKLLMTLFSNVQDQINAGKRAAEGLKMVASEPK